MNTINNQNGFGYLNSLSMQPPQPMQRIGADPQQSAAQHMNAASAASSKGMSMGGGAGAGAEGGAGGGTDWGAIKGIISMFAGG